MSEQMDLFSQKTETQLTQLWSADEIYDRMSADNVSIIRESRRLERKSAGISPKSLGEYLSMFANTAPDGGVIVVGVEDSGKITGCLKAGEKRKNELENLSIFCEDAKWVSKELPIKNDKGESDFILVYRVFYREDRVVETSSHKAFIREGGSKYEMDDSVKREHRISKGEILYELESINLKFPEDFDIFEIDLFCKSFSEIRGFTNDHSKKDILQLAKLGKTSNGTFLPNLACGLLFANDPRSIVPGAFVRILRYNGTEEKFGKDLNVIFDIYIEGPIPKLLELARATISSQIRSNQRLSGSRIERTPEYPEGAWFEAVVNAVAHRSYNLKNQNIFVKMFDDRIVVESPGGFVPPTTPQSIYTAHNPRNLWLMQAMMYMRLTFCGYEGTRRMRSEMRAAQLREPRFVQIEATSHQVHTILYNKLIAPTDSIGAKSLIINLTDEEIANASLEERKILEYLAGNAFVTITMACDLTKRSKPTTRKYLTRLKEAGLVEVMGDGNRWNAPKKSYRLAIRK